MVASPLTAPDEPQTDLISAPGQLTRAVNLIQSAPADLYLPDDAAEELLNLSRLGLADVKANRDAAPERELSPELVEQLRIVRAAVSNQTGRLSRLAEARILRIPRGGEVELPDEQIPLEGLEEAKALVHSAFLIVSDIIDLAPQTASLLATYPSPKSTDPLVAEIEMRTF